MYVLWASLIPPPQQIIFMCKNAIHCYHISFLSTNFCTMKYNGIKLEGYTIRKLYFDILNKQLDYLYMQYMMLNLLNVVCGNFYLLKVNTILQNHCTTQIYIYIYTYSFASIIVVTIIYHNTFHCSVHSPKLNKQ